MPVDLGMIACLICIQCIMTDCHCGDLLIYRRRAMPTIKRIWNPILSYTRSFSHPEAPLPGKSTAFSITVHHQSTKAGVGFYASRRPEPGLNYPFDLCRVVRHCLLFVQRSHSPCRTKRSSWPHLWPWFPTTSLARQVGDNACTNPRSVHSTSSSSSFSSSMAPSIMAPKKKPGVAAHPSISRDRDAWPPTLRGLRGRTGVWTCGEHGRCRQRHHHLPYGRSRSRRHRGRTTSTTRQW